YWETEDEGVQELVHMIAEKSNSDETYVRLAHRVVRERVKLKTHLNERRGAARALREKEGDCDEHADLLVTLARAVQIPARRVVGHYFRDEDRSEAHAWCEVLLQRYGWVPVDPALDRFGILTERYFARMREGLVSERPTILLRYNRTSSQSLRIEESVRISKQDNRLRTKRSP
ncbi:MAG: transglutaminase-like domain-containing protein, partial [Candidatus Thorarchaeota archaeon]